MTNSQDVILVTAATGKIGSALVSLLASSASQPVVRVATRNPESSSALLLKALNPDTVQPVLFNEDEPVTVKQACEGVTKLGIIAPFTPDMQAWHKNVMELAQANGNLDYIVKVSVTGARSPESDPPPGRVPLNHWLGEEAIRQTGVANTVIRPTIFMQHFMMTQGLYVRGNDKFYLPTGTAKVAWLDCRDIAMMMAKLLGFSPAQRVPYEGQAYELTGASGVTAQEMSDILSWASGRKISHVDGEDAFVERCKELGVPDTAKHFYKEAKDGWFAKTDYEAFVKITGRYPNSFAKFAFDNAAYFQVV
jgi:uncharacterized protein YbjT (DUF2867 family)